MRCLTVQARAGVSLVELMIVMLCMAIAAAVVAPIVFNSPAAELRAAGRLLTADLEYAQHQSRFRGDDPRLIVFDADGGGYRLAARSDPASPLIEPVSGQPYALRFGEGRGKSLPRVRISDLEVGGDNVLGFGRLGQLDQTMAARITLECGGLTLKLTLDPVTGEIEVGEIE